MTATLNGADRIDAILAIIDTALDDTGARDFEAEGAAAYAAPGVMCIVPGDILVDYGTAAAEAWYRGWHAAADKAAWKALEEA